MNCDTRAKNRPSRSTRRQKSTAALGLILAGLVVVSRAAAQTATLSDEKRTKIETAISNFIASSKVPGVSAAVVQDGEFVWSAGFGMADLENSVRATSQTLYRLGSISKPITATAAMALWERDRLDLDAPVQKYCPAFPQKPWPITTRELLGHLGGIRYYNVPELPYSVSQADPEVHAPLRKWHRRRPEVFRQRLAGRAARNTFQLFDTRLHADWLRHRGSVA